MSTSYLNREQADLPESIWSAIDEAAGQAAADLLTGRRFLDLDGPYGLGLTALEVGADDFCRQPSENEAGAILSRAISLPMIRRSCELSIRRVAAHLQMGQPLDLSPVEDAAEAVARREEEFIYYGQKDFGLDGLLTADGRHSRPASDWSKVQNALDDVLRAVDALDGAGFHGPYALALSPSRYNNLFRRYEGSDMIQLDHLRRLCELGVFKAPIDGAVVVDAHVGRIVVGQDVRTGYSANDGIHYSLFVSESAGLLLQEPEAICTLDGKSK
jgi:uncharacterized linocin/CFP29 family protein